MKDKSSLIQRILLLLLVGFVVMACGLLTDPPREQVENNDNVALSRGAQIGEVVTAESIGANNEPIEVTDRFSASEDVIYVVAEADYIESGATLFARWSREGQPFEDSSMITANQDYEDTYVEFHLESLNEEMEEGDYSVQLFVNGNPVATVDFSVE
jgi:hypothetical protein